MSDRTRRQYSDEEKAVALATLDANGGDVRKTARDTGIPFSTLQGWAHQRGVNESVTELAVTKKKNLADELERIALALVDAIPDKIDGASLQQVATAAGIAVDKMQLLRGEPTGITKDVSDARTRLADKLNRLSPSTDTGPAPAASGESDR
jgi:transposase-like protein